MTKKALFLIAFLLLSFFSTAQVTIGISDKPIDGAILDLRNEPILSGGISTKGLGLPRVQLKAIDKLIMGDTDIADGDYDGDQYFKHTGLVVYHVQSPDDICARLPSGTYVWEGTEWQPLGFSLTPEKPKNELPITSTTGLNQPNSYIVSERSVLKIPIAKAISIWKNEYQGDLTKDSDALSGLLSGANTINNWSTIELEAKLLWTSDLCSDKLIMNSKNLELKGEGDNRYIEVWVSDKKGNAVVALVRKGEDPMTKALWSWHVWATDTPATMSYNNTEITYQPMDRNLGAISATPGDTKTIGLHYQFGRKDPIPTSDAWDNSPMKVYDANEVAINHSTKIVSVSSLSSNEQRFVKAVNAPLTLLVGVTETVDNDWYTVGEGVVGSTGTWIDRWGANPSTVKSPFDPCPEGWRIPRRSGNVGAYPWNGGTHPYNGLNTSNFVSADKGRTHATAGYFPFAGAHHYLSGALVTVGTSCYQGTASHNTKNATTRVIFSTTGVDVQDGSSGRSIGYAVRCVKQ